MGSGQIWYQWNGGHSGDNEGSLKLDGDEVEKLEIMVVDIWSEVVVSKLIRSSALHVFKYSRELSDLLSTSLLASYLFLANY